MKFILFVLLPFIALGLAACAAQTPAAILTSTAITLPPTLTSTPTLTPTLTASATITPTFTPTPLGNSGQLYYSACNQSNLCTGIYSIDLNNYQLTPITNSGELINISPDGRRMIMNQDGQTYVSDMDGENKAAIPPANRISVLWLPDSEHIAYVQYDSQNTRSDIYVSNWDGSEPKKITGEDDKPFSLLGISTMGNETKLYYGAEDPARQRIPLGVRWINVDTGAQGRISEEGQSIDCTVHGNRMACIGGPWYLYLVNLDTRNSIELIRSEDLSKEPPGVVGRAMFWSPDGEKLIASSYMCKPKCDKSIAYAFSTSDGTLLHQSSEIDGSVFLSDISPDGRRVLLFGYQNDRFDSKPTLYILNLDDFTITDLSELELPVPQGTWHGTVQWLPVANP